MTLRICRWNNIAANEAGEISDDTIMIGFPSDEGLIRSSAEPGCSNQDNRIFHHINFIPLMLSESNGCRDFPYPL
jgi:hypothetical protein